MPAPIDEVDVTGLNEILLAEDRGVVLDFWGTWCQPCRTLRPHLERLADEHADRWRVVAVHVEEQPVLVDRYRVTSTPTLVFLRQGDEVGRLAGAVSLGDIAEALAEAR